MLLDLLIAYAVSFYDTNVFFSWTDLAILRWEATVVLLDGRFAVGWRGREVLDRVVVSERMIYGEYW